MSAVVRELRRNVRSRSHVTIDLAVEQRHDPGALARAVRRNTAATQLTVKLLLGDEASLEQWNPFWRAVASHGAVTHLCLQHEGLAAFPPVRWQQEEGESLFCPPMLAQALEHLIQRQTSTPTTALRHISLCGVNLTWDQTPGTASTPLSSFLDKAESITTVSLVRCLGDDASQAQGIALALRRKANLHTLELLHSSETISLAILQKFATTSSASASAVAGPPVPPCNIKTLSVSSYSFGDGSRVRRPSPGELARAVQQLLETNDSLETVELQGQLSRDNCALIVRGMKNSESVSALRFKNFIYYSSDDDDDDDDSLSNLLLQSSKMFSLTMVDSNFPPQQMLEACLRRSDSPLRRLEIQQREAVSLNSPLPMRTWQIRSLVSAIQNSRLEELVLPTITDRETFLLVADSCFGATTKYLKKFASAITFDSRTVKDELLATLRRNFSLRSVQVTRQGHDIFYNFREKERLALYMDRNAKLEAFVQNPASLPFELWPLAVRWAKEAGHDTLYRCLVRVLGSQVETVEGLSSLAASMTSHRAPVRKRKRSNEDNNGYE